MEPTPNTTGGPEPNEPDKDAGRSPAPQEFDGRMIGLDGSPVYLARWLFLWLCLLNRRWRSSGIVFLERDRALGLWRIQSAVLRVLGPLLETPRFNPRLTVRALDLGRVNGRSPDSGRPTLLSMLGGRDLPDSRELESSLDRTPAPRGAYSEALAALVVHDVVSRRRDSARRAGRAKRHPTMVRRKVWVKRDKEIRG